MQLTELILHNFGAYRGRQVVDLTTTPSRPIVLIGGLNGCGKTTLLDALQLVLYGNRARLSNRGSQAYEDFLRATISRTVDPSEGASVALTFDVTVEGEPHRYQVVRSWASTGKKVKENLDVFLDGEWNAALSTNWADHIEDLLPLEIAGLFFFDGEKIEALADPDRAATVIQTAVHSLLGASTLEQLRTDLLALQRRQMPDSGDAALDQRLTDLLDQHAQSQASASLVRERHRDTRHQLEDARGAVTQAEREFARDGGDLFERRASLEAERAATAAQLLNTQSQLRGLAEGSLPLALVRLQIGEALAQAGSEAAARDAEQVVQLLFERDAWLLDRIPADSRAAIELILSEDRASRCPAGTTANYLDLRADEFATLLALPGQLDHEQDVARSLLGSASALSSRLDVLDTQLAGVPTDDAIRQRQSDLSSSRGLRDRVEGQLSVLSEDLAQLERESRNLEEQLAKVEAERLKVNVANDDVRRILHYTERVRETLALLRTRLIERHLSKIEVATLDSFRTLMRKEGLVADLRIDPATYAISLTSSKGHRIEPSRLSAGERQLLAVALLWGLARVAGNRLPTVIDTPLGRLDSVHRQHLVERYFPRASEQVLLLSTDKEIDESLLGLLAPSLSQTYILDHDGATEETTITPGYWWAAEVPHVA